MTEYELDQYCDRHKDCDCMCMKCKAFAEYQRQELGLDEAGDETDKA